MKGIAAIDEGLAWQAVLQRDRAQEGRFVYGVTSTRVFCRPGCPARLPRRDRVVFFQNAAAARASGFRPCLRCRPEDAAAPTHALLTAAKQILDEAESALTLAQLAARLGVSAGRLQRAFKRGTGLSPREYALARRFDRLKSGLRGGSDVTSAIYDAGFGSASRVYERSATLMGMTPEGYRRRGAGRHISYGFAPTPLGLLLLAATQDGICFVALGDSEAELEAALVKEFPAASLSRGDGELHDALTALVAHLEGRAAAPQLALALEGTAFQMLVWKLLRTIPAGATRSYGQIAQAAGHPGAARAVARVCASNPVAVLVPCHRVIRSDGRPGGYRWGAERKQQLLQLEANAAAPVTI